MAPKLSSSAALDLINVPFDDLMLEYSYDWLNDPEIQVLIDSKPVERSTQRAWFESLKNRNDLFIWGIHYQHKPIGVFGLKNIANKQGEYWGYIGDKECWGKGIGNWMMERIVDLTRDKGIERIYLKVLPDNTRALNLYLKHGFKLVSNKLCEPDDKFLILDRNL